VAEQPVPTRQGFIEADGHTIHWECFGDGSREAVCLLNGLAMHTKAWTSFLPLLQPEFDVLLYDYLGQGESSAPDEPYSISRLAAYLTMIMDALRIERIHSMGISYGGFVAIEHARQFHDRLHTLTLSGIILSREELFEMYEALSLRFYGLGPMASASTPTTFTRRSSASRSCAGSGAARSSRCGRASRSATRTASTPSSVSPRHRKSTSASSTTACPSTAR